LEINMDGILGAVITVVVIVGVLGMVAVVAIVHNGRFRARVDRRSIRIAVNSDEEPAQADA